VGEGRGLPEGNTTGETRSGRSAGLGVSSDLVRVRQVARKNKDVRFTALLHHVTVDRLREAYRAISPDAAAGSQMGGCGRSGRLAGGQDPSDAAWNHGLELSSSGGSSCTSCLVS
jgi:hypothetical protein